MESAQEGSCNRDELNRAISQTSQSVYDHKTLNPFLKSSDAVFMPFAQGMHDCHQTGSEQASSDHGEQVAHEVDSLGR